MSRINFNPSGTGWDGSHTLGRRKAGLSFPSTVSEVVYNSSHWPLIGGGETDRRRSECDHIKGRYLDHKQPPFLIKKCLCVPDSFVKKTDSEERN